MDAAETSMDEGNTTRTASTVLDKADPGEVDTRTAATADSRGDTGPRLQRGDRIDRYIILDTLGQGGMGVVHKAHDPELDRLIALKLHHVDISAGSNATHARDRLLREAQALAQLSHPNVVAAYDVGTHDQDIFVAMELVEGETLKAWLKAERRSQREIIAVFVAAGRGLAAAHAAGLIHRDFKPDNVLVGSDGRVRVADFGLARAADEVGDDDPPVEEADSGPRPGEPLSASSQGRLVSPVTQVGTIVGTPRYMAPEQFLGLRLDAHTDQFSFCVTLHEALFGCRPFPAASVGELKKRVVAGDIAPAPPRVRVAKRWRRLIRRGLSVAREDRYPSMDALLDDLSRDTSARRWSLFAVGVMVLALTGVVVAAPWRSRTGAVCAGADEKIDQVWGLEVKRRVRAAFVATTRTYAEDTFARVERVLDHRTQEWSAMRVDVCRATRVHAEQSERVLDLRMYCLDQRLAEINALTKIMGAEADEQVLDRAVQAVLELPNLAQCADVTALTTLSPLPAHPNQRRAVAGLRARLATVNALNASGKHALALSEAAEIERSTRVLDYPPLRAEALNALGWSQARNGQLDEALENLQAASLVAAPARYDHLLAKAAANTLYVVGLQQRRYEIARELMPLAESIVARAGRPTEIYVEFLATKGFVAFKNGDHEGALATFEHALALAATEELAFGAAHVHNLLGNFYVDTHDYDRAVVHIRSALGIWEEQLGQHHPKVAVALNNLGSAMVALDRRVEAKALFERALAIYRSALGPSHPKVAIASLNLADMLVADERFDLALPLLAEAEKILADTYGDEHPYVAVALTGQGRCLIALARAGEARPLLERAVVMRGRGPDSDPGLAIARFALAQALWDGKGDRRRAVSLARQAGKVFAEHEDGKVERALVDKWLAAHSAD